MYNEIKRAILFSMLLGLNTPAQAIFGFDAISNFFSKNKTIISAATAIAGIGALAYWYFKPKEQFLNYPDVTWEALRTIDSSSYVTSCNNDNAFFERRKTNSDSKHLDIMGTMTDIERTANEIQPYLYKIHLMPTNYNIETIKEIIDILSKPEIAQHINQFKFRLHGGISKLQNSSRIPLIIIYAKSEFKRISTFEENLARTRKHAQELLNHIYYEIRDRDIPGLDEQPCYNAKVTPLIWVAQGNGDDRDLLPQAHTASEDGQFLGPEYIYANPRFDFTTASSESSPWKAPQRHNDNGICYLHHPENNEPLIDANIKPHSSNNPPPISSE